MRGKEITGKIILKLFGWKHRVLAEYRIRKAVMIGAPHTSNWDIVFSLAGMWAAGYRPRFFIKKEWIDNPLVGWLIRWLGGIGVDRSKRNRLTEHAADMLRREKELVLLVPVEGTRKRVSHWKKGFYYIALETGLPVLLAYLDYGKKEAGVGGMVYLTGHFEKDMQQIEDFYRNIRAKYPEQYNPEIYIRSQKSETGK